MDARICVYTFIHLADTLIAGIEERTETPKDPESNDLIKSNEEISSDFTALAEPGVNRMDDADLEFEEPQEIILSTTEEVPIKHHALRFRKRNNKGTSGQATLKQNFIYLGVQQFEFGKIQ